MAAYSGGGSLASSIAQTAHNTTAATTPTVDSHSTPQPAVSYQPLGRNSDGTSQSVAPDLWDVENSANVQPWTGRAAPAGCHRDNVDRPDVCELLRGRADG
jgi:hypothetical protein